VCIFCYLERGGSLSHGRYLYNYSDADQRTYRLAMAAYPATLGALEGLMYLAMKAGQSIYDKWAAGDHTQFEHPMFITVLLALGRKVIIAHPFICSI
jgi:hypothetical protein